MIKNNLIKSCVCGNDKSFTKTVINKLEVAECDVCGVMHQELDGWTPSQYLNFYATDYHLEYQKKKGVVTYSDRYSHDRNIAKLRLLSYKGVIQEGGVGLDIGSSNSAFVHEAIEQGYRCTGLEPGVDIGDDLVTIRGTLESINLAVNHYDFVTMHDSIEHMIDINCALQKVRDILKVDGVLIVDLPDYFVPAGQHHWKYIEHLWILNRSQLINVFHNWGLNTFRVDSPIPGKLVFFAKKL